MAILKVTASKDNTITNAYEANLVTRGTGSNMGASDILEVFSIYAQQTSSSVEIARTLVEFPLSKISSERASGNLPASGSVKFFLKLYNAPHTEPVPENFELYVLPISQSWQEGRGLDMVEYSDLTFDKEGSNWINAKEHTAATATIVASTPGSLSNAATFTLTDAAGTTTTYRINGGGSGTGTDDYQTQPGGTAGSTIEVFFKLASTVAHVAEAITKAINATTNADMTATNDGTNITVTQTTKGTAGNKTNTDNSTGLTSVGNFTGAVGQWTTQGGDYLYSYAITSSFAEGTEDLVQDVTSIVEDWLTGSSGGKYDNYGFGIILKTSHEQEERSFFTKKFFARNTEFYYKKPCLEARWDDSLKDDRGSFYASSSLAGASDNLNTIYLYNRIRGRLSDIPNAPTSASLRYTETGANQVTASATKVSTGIYKASFALQTTASTIYDVWYSGSTAYHTGTIQVNSFAANVLDENSKYVVSIVNNDHTYNAKQKARFKLYTRLKNWSPNLYTVAQNSPENLIIEDAIYKIYRVSDGEEIIPYGSGSTKFTQLSYNVSGNYFDLDMSLFETGYEYGIKLSFYDDYLNSYKEQPYVFKFKVVE